MPAGRETLPGLRSDYSPAHLLRLPLDPDGNNVEAVCLT